ncbi:MAG: hypothetical protein NTW49_01215 [Bacteroidia bacterium]|nr:hypothetical protein [Bacteroidia bacterium]
MVTKVENGFIAKLEKARELIEICSKFQGFSPSGKDELPENMYRLIDLVLESYYREKELTEMYETAVDRRLKAYKFEENSLEERLLPILTAVQAFIGKDSSDFKKVNNLVKKIKTSKVIKVIVFPNQPDADQAMAKSEKSFEAILDLFNEMVTIISELPRYKPSAIHVKTETLKLFSEQIIKMNFDVNNTYRDLSETRINRKYLYEEMKNRIQIIKLYVKNKYGNNSKENEQIKGIRV